MTTRRPTIATLRRVVALLVLAFLVTGCASGASPAAPASASPAPGGASGTDDPNAPVGAPGGGANGGANGGFGGGIADGQPKLVVAVPGQRNVHPVGIDRITARVSGRHVVLNARWYSGVEPCSVLDSVGFEINDSTITVSVREGNGAADVPCIDIALLKATVIDLGELAPGSYTVVPDVGSAAAVALTVG